MPKRIAVAEDSYLDDTVTYHYLAILAYRYSCLYQAARSKTAFLSTALSMLFFSPSLTIRASFCFATVLLGILFFLPTEALALYLPVRAAILYNKTTGTILFQQNADLRIPPASLTKVMTLCIALDYVQSGKLSLKKKVTISPLAATTKGSSMHLRRGERVPFGKLLMGTAVASGNDAAMSVALAVQPNLQKFVSIMNYRARKYKMRNTVFKNPTGLPAKGQLTTARDMLTLALIYLARHPEASRYHTAATFTHGGRVLSTTNGLLGSVCGVNGLKTGWTVASGYNIIVTAKRGKQELVCVILGGKSRVGRDITARKLIEAGFRAPSSRKEVLRILEGKEKRKPTAVSAPSGKKQTPDRGASPKRRQRH